MQSGQIVWFKYATTSWLKSNCAKYRDDIWPRADVRLLGVEIFKWNVVPVLDRQHTTAFQWVNVTMMQHVPSYEQGPNVTSNHTLVLFMICHKHSPKISPIIIYVIYLLMAYFVSWQRDIPLICKQIDSTVGNHHTSNTCAACTVHKIKPLWLSFNHVFTSLLKSAEYYEENSLNFLLSYHDVTF